MLNESISYGKVLMVSPEHFDVVYAINPHMTNDKGELNTVNRELAQLQWRNLKAIFEQTGINVEIIPGEKNLPDMVFAANQSFLFKNNSTGKFEVLISNMRSEFRKPETLYFYNWYKEHGYKVYTSEEIFRDYPRLCFEGNGDIIPHPDFSFYWGGIGPRTDAKVYEILAKKLNLNFLTLDLIHPEFYHLDTCFLVLNNHTCAYVAEAFDSAGLKLINSKFKSLIRIDQQEAKKYFAGNAFCPDGKNVIMHPGASRFKEALVKNNFNVLETDTSEYMKSGGSVFCMKMALV